MPLPVFYLEFHKQHGRHPKPSEMTLEQQRSLRRCFIQNRDNALRRREAGIDKSRKAFRQLPSPDPSRWHEILKELSEPERSQLMKLIMQETPERVWELMQQWFASQDTDVERWERLLREYPEIEAPVVFLDFKPDDQDK